MKARHLLPHFPISPFDPGLLLAEAAVFNLRTPELGETLALSSGQLSIEAYIDSIGGVDFQNLPNILVKMSTGASDGLVIRTVFGATDKMPLRGLSYILPGLVLIEDLAKKGIKPPQLQIIFAHHISAGLGNLDIAEAKRESKILAGVASNYVNTFFPNVSDSVVFLEDTEINKGTPLRKALIETTATFRRTVSSEVSHDLELKGGKNGSTRKALFYGAAHVLVHDMACEGIFNPLLADQVEPVFPEAIINIGGVQEKFFYDLRQSLKPYLAASNVDTLQYFSKHRVPPYYMARGEDIALGNILAGKVNLNEVTPAAQHDLSYLHKVSFARGDIQDFFDSERSKK